MVPRGGGPRGGGDASGGMEASEPTGVLKVWLGKGYLDRQ